MRTSVNILFIFLVILFLSIDGCLSNQQNTQTPISEPIQKCNVMKTVHINDIENAKVNDYISMIRGINGVILFHLDGVNESADPGGIEIKFENGNFHYYGNKKDAKIIAIDENKIQIEVFDKNLSEYLVGNNLCMK